MSVNRNANIIKAIQPYVFRGGEKYETRYDEFSGSIVIAMPGALFESSLSETGYAFQMTSSYDDISHWVRAGGRYVPPISERVPIYVSASLDPNSSSYDPGYPPKWETTQEVYYTASVMTAGVNSFTAQKTFPIWEGTNIQFTSSFVIESWVNFGPNPVVANYIPGGWSPYVPWVSKYTPTFTGDSQYLAYVGWGGFTHDADDGGIGPSPVEVSGSVQFAYSTNFQSGSQVARERYLEATASFDIEPDTWYHYALVYTSGSETGGIYPDRYLKWYRDGHLISRKAIPGWATILPAQNEFLQIMGVVDDDYVDGGYNSSTASFQDFRLYNGTDKNYTGSYFTPPQSMVRIKDEYQ